MDVFDGDSEEERIIHDDEHVFNSEENQNNHDNVDVSNKNVKKRIVRKPQPKLNSERLQGLRGLGILGSHFQNIKFKGKGFEKEDLNAVMSSLELWAHRLYPKFMFDDTLNRLEQLGHKSQVSTYIKKLRLDMETDSNEIDIESTVTNEDEHFQTTLIDNTFDNLLNENQQQNVFPTLTGCTYDNSLNENQQQNTLTEKQREIINRNRLLAAERRLARFEAKKINDESLATDKRNEKC